MRIKSIWHRPRPRRRRGPRAVGCLLLVLVGTILLDAGVPAGSPVSGAHRPAAGVPYRAPLVGPIVVLRPFEAPPSPYAAGHRGVDLAASPGAVVVAAAAGRVTFAGQVAGRGVMVIAHADGTRTEYEPIRPLVAAGTVVAAGRPIGLLRGTHDPCPPSRCLHWGARRAGRYIDPMLLLRPLGPVRLLPWPPHVRPAIAWSSARPLAHPRGRRLSVVVSVVDLVDRTPRYARGCAREYACNSRSTDTCV